MKPTSGSSCSWGSSEIVDDCSLEDSPEEFCDDTSEEELSVQGGLLFGFGCFLVPGSNNATTTTIKTTVNAEKAVIKTIRLFLKIFRMF
jgi:hypothetical protein